ncbi:MAG: protein kinase, partial [Oscillospiraceae bacterium]
KLCENCFEEITSQPCPHCCFDPAVPAADPTVLAPGSVLLGKYIVGRTIGKGGFGITYLAYDTTADKKVAIKEYYPYGLALRATGNPTVAVSTTENADAFKAGAERFYEEAKLVSRFNGNPNIVAVHEFFYENDTVYFAMEYLSGRSLKDHIQSKGPLTAGQALFIAQNVSNALMVAHSASVLHRDISPDNIMLCSNGEVKIIDFGAARQVLAERSQTFSVILKPGFAPLEQYQKKGKQGPWTDIYSLGATLFYALTGVIPDDPMSRQEEDASFAENKYNINEELWDIIVKATMIRIPDRYQDIFELRRDLNQVSFAAELIVPPAPQETAPQESFRTAMPFGTSTASTASTVSTPTMQRTQPVQQEVPVRTAEAAPQEKPAGFFAAHKKPLIAAISGTAAVAAAAVIIAVALNSGGKPSDGMIHDPEYSHSSYDPLGDTTYSSLPETTTTDSSYTGPTGTSPVEYDSSEPEEITSEPEASTPKPATTTTTKSTPKPEPESKQDPEPEITKPVTTTTTAKPVESKPEEVKEVTICGTTYSTDLTELRITESACDKAPTNKDYAQIKYLKNLEKLELLEMGSVTELSFLKEMPKLTYLSVGNNDNVLTDISAIGKLTNLKYLSIGYSQKLSDISAIGKLTKLETLNLSHLDKVNDLSSLGTLTNLSELKIWQVPCDNISFLKKMTKLTYLQIDYTDYYGTIKDISVLSNLKNLDYLGLTRLPITDISAISQLNKLTRLNIEHCPNIKSFTPISKLKSLTFLRLFNNRITDPSFAYGLSNLETLWLTGQLNYGEDKNEIADCDLETLKSKLPNCDVH